MSHVRSIVGGFLLLVIVSCTLWYWSSIAVPVAPSRVSTNSSSLLSSTSTTITLLDRLHTPIKIEDSEPSLIPLLFELSSGLGTGTTSVSIDQELQAALYRALEKVALARGYVSGAGVFMDVKTGELLALVSYAPAEPTVNLATRGLFIPGSIIKPFVALAGLEENLIEPADEILSTGAIVVRDERGGSHTFKDWKAHGRVNLKTALGVSSNVYFYALGGGYEDQPGLGIEAMTGYFTLFGLGQPTGLAVLKEATGTVPTPEWKRRLFRDDEWRLADTYLAAIGQHGYALTPLQLTRAVAAIATAGTLVTPTILHTLGAPSSGTPLPIATRHFTSVQAGMEYAVYHGTAAGLYQERRSLAVKTGTAEADAFKQKIHSWVVGYTPAISPRYAFTIVLAHGPWGEETGAVAVTADLWQWLERERPASVSPD